MWYDVIASTLAFSSKLGVLRCCLVVELNIVLFYLYEILCHIDCIPTFIIQKLIQLCSLQLLAFQYTCNHVGLGMVFGSVWSSARWETAIPRCRRYMYVLNSKLWHLAGLIDFCSSVNIYICNFIVKYLQVLWFLWMTSYMHWNSRKVGKLWCKDGNHK